MTALLRVLSDTFARVRASSSDVRPEAGADDYPPRKPVGLYAQLSPEQRRLVRSYDGAVGSGRSDMPRLRGSRQRA